MAVKITSSGPRGAKTYEVRVDGKLYDYTDTRAAAERAARAARAEQKGGSQRNPAKAVRLKNFTGTIRVNPNKTVSIRGKAKRKR